MTPDLIFDVVRAGMVYQLPLSQLWPDEVLGLANQHLRHGDERTAQMLYRYQHRRRVPRPRPPEGAA